MLSALILFVILIILTIMLINTKFKYWSKRGIVSPRPSTPFGHYPKSFTNKRKMVAELDEIYSKYKDKEDFVGIYRLWRPQLFILNPKLCHKIYTKYFDHFHDNEFARVFSKNSDILFRHNPFALTGDVWKDTRAHFAAGLESETIEASFYKNRETARKFCQEIQNHIERTPKVPVQIKELCLNYASEVVTDCVFGFRFCGLPTTQLVFNTIVNTFKRTLHAMICFFIAMLVPSAASRSSILFTTKPLTNLFEKLMHTAIELRKPQAEHKNHQDFLNYLLRLQKAKNLSIQDMTSYVMPFVLHGLMAFYLLLAHCLLLLAKNPKAQKDLQNEILRNMNKSGGINFETLSKLPFLDACVHETARKMTPLIYASKVCTEPILLKSKSGCTIKLEKGDNVLLPLHSLMNDESLYDNPAEFQPERFLNQNGFCIVNEYHEKGIFYGFGAGPRKCIGERFALTQIKAALVDIFIKFNVRVNSKTSESYESDQNYYSKQMDNIWLDFDARN